MRKREGEDEQPSTQPDRSLRTVVRQLSEVPRQVERVLRTMEPVRALARSLAHKDTVLFLGRHVGYPVALEGALKLKELAYMHAEGFAAGELKHGPIALIDQGTPVVCVVPSPAGRSSVPAPSGRSSLRR